MRYLKPIIVTSILFFIFSSIVLAGDYLEGGIHQPTTSIKLLRSAVVGSVSYNSLVSDAAYAKWNYASSAFDFVEGSSSSHHVKVIAVNYPDVSWTGSTTYSWNSTTMHMTSTTIKLNHALIGDDDRARQMNTALHELGHALGLDHQSSSSSIMYPYQTSIDYIPSADANRATYLYGTIHANE